MESKYYIFVFVLILTASNAKSADEIEKPIQQNLYIQAGSYTHFSDSENYVGNPVFISAEFQRSDHWLYGLGLFNNSYDQFSQYLYGGYNFEFKNRWKNFHSKVTMGIIHGYKGEFQNNIPYNSSGFAPAIIPGIGWKKNKLGFDMILLGNAGMLFTVGYDIF